jgi:hypothetical protein
MLIRAVGYQPHPSALPLPWRRVFVIGFSNWPVEVKHFQAVFSGPMLMSLAGSVLLSGIGAKALPLWDQEDKAERSLERPCRLI